MRTPARSVSGLPLVFFVGGIQSMTALAVLDVEPVTVTSKAGSALEYCPLLALMMTSSYAPVCVLLGVPSRSPVAMLKVAQAGLCCTENDSVLPSGSLAVG